MENVINVLKVRFPDNKKAQLVFVTTTNDWYYPKLHDINAIRGFIQWEDSRGVITTLNEANVVSATLYKDGNLNV